MKKLTSALVNEILLSMKRFYKKNKNITIAIVIVLFILALFFLISKTEKDENLQSNYLPNKSMPLSVQIPSTPYPTYPQFTAISDPLLPPVPSGWVTGDHVAYTIKFPYGWKPNVTNVIGNGTNVVLVQPGSNYFPRLNFEVVPANPDMSVEKRIERLKGLNPSNYSEIKTSFRGMLATQITEILPITDLQGNPVHKTYLFFGNEKTTYVVTFAYFQDSQAETNKLKLLQILNSITLK